MMRHPFAAFVLAGVVGLGTLTLSGTAEAGRGRVRFSSGARFSGHWHGRTSVRFARPAFRPRVWVGGNVYVGGYYPRPYYYYYYPYYPEAVPSYYGSYYPVQAETAPAPPGVVAGPVAAPVRERRLPMFGIGVAGGFSRIDDTDAEAGDTSLFVRLRVTPGLILEGDFGKTEFKDSQREDRRFGLSGIYEFGARNAVSPYLVLSGGVRGDFDNDDEFTSRQTFVEGGIGLRIALSRNLHLTGDYRWGANEAVEDEGEYRILIDDGIDDSEEYQRARFAAVLYF